MDVLGDVVARERRSDAPALRVPSVGRSYDYRRFCTTTWKVGNFLRHLGVRHGARVAVGADPLPEPVVTFYGAALLGAVVGFDPAGDVDEDVRALVVHAADLEAHDVRPSTKRVAYGDAPVDPSVAYFERDVWSENPTEPPDGVGSDDPLLSVGEGTLTHGEILEAAGTAVEALSIERGTTVVVEGSFDDPRVVVAGLVAPLVAGATVAIGPDAEGDVLVGGRGDDLPAEFDATLRAGTDP